MWGESEASAGAPRLLQQCHITNHDNITPLPPTPPTTVTCVALLVPPAAIVMPLSQGSPGAGSCQGHLHLYPTGSTSSTISSSSSRKHLLSRFTTIPTPDAFIGAARQNVPVAPRLKPSTAMPSSRCTTQQQQEQQEQQERRQQQRQHSPPVRLLLPVL